MKISFCCPNGIITKNFWISEFLVILLTGYYRWMDGWNPISYLISALVLLITVQYCIICVKKLSGKYDKLYYKLFVLSNYVFSNLYLVLGNMFWFARSHEVNFGFVIGLTVILLPLMLIHIKMINEKTPGE
ncbi:MAG: hypothetical protein IJP16_09790 [Clostridia bacterium]|nr:hypothetical protein [Clostridia bacterium]